jgi:hypothetical protein
MLILFIFWCNMYLLNEWSFNKKGVTNMIISKNKTGSKSELALKIYIEMIESETQFSRKDVLERFQSEANLTLEGSKTYYYNISKKFKDVK